MSCVNSTKLKLPLFLYDFILLFSVTTCSGDQFRCLDGICLSIDKRCNGIPDCRNGEDEHQCGKLTRFFPLFKTYTYSIEFCIVKTQIDYTNAISMIRSLRESKLFDSFVFPCIVFANGNNINYMLQHVYNCLTNYEIYNHFCNSSAMVPAISYHDKLAPMLLVSVGYPTRLFTSDREGRLSLNEHQTRLRSLPTRLQAL